MFFQWFRPSTDFHVSFLRSFRVLTGLSLAPTPTSSHSSRRYWKALVYLETQDDCLLAINGLTQRVLRSNCTRSSNAPALTFSSTHTVFAREILSKRS